ncbi:MAG: hypothetical protein DRJ26_05395 [Candidatus Methanomethylicota archaeon]|uniref:Uncharacterized protein n=1 Tax=Thermoproteota archaeon TaxID=2056631 RepID=A0A497EWQ3_9CREN|nr:MAG: hypothetical protein DRJ26_05395 [Candidatus Verstraetearchaeota archaeon]
MVKDRELISRLAVLQESVNGILVEISNIRTAISSITEKLEDLDRIEQIVAELAGLKLEISALKSLINMLLSLNLALKLEKKMRFDKL